MTCLSVNINKVALLRNSRGGNLPDVIRVAKDCEMYGAEGITVHPRPDERHTRYQDVRDLKPVVTTELNVEGYPDERFMQLVLEVVPDQCTLVPDPPGVITSSEGWDTIEHRIFLTDIIKTLKAAGIRVSLFIDPDLRHVDGAADTGTDRIELYTGRYAAQYHSGRDEAIRPHILCAERAKGAGLGVNAGHDLNLENLRFYRMSVPGLHEVSIGHALISDALYFGLQNVIGMYRNCLREVNMA